MVAFEQARISPAMPLDSARTLSLPRETLAAMLAQVEAGYPNEACGVLAGCGGRVVKHFPAANASATPRTFSEIEPRKLLATWNEIEAHGWELLAYYHSHPETPAYPSPRDVQWSRNWPGTFYIIVSLAEPERPVVRAFLIEGDAIHEHRIVLES
jgi:proteasome lid subunit RPN8/RPN11